MVTSKPANRSSLITAVLVAAAVSGVAILWVHIHKTEVRSQLGHARQELLDKSTQLASLPQPSSIQPGQIDGPAAYQVQLLKKAEGPISAASFHPPSAAMVYFASGKAAVQAYDNAQAALNSAHNLVSYQAKVMAALQKTLEYNPTADFRKFDLKTSDTQSRLTRARQGLAAALNAIGGLPEFDDPTMPAVTKQIQNLQAARATLAKDGNVAAWSSAFSSAQTAILKNRQAFWEKQEQSVNQKLLDANNSLAHLQADIR